uniref:Uncharacterized protein n=1 Tax=Utricularia reniformis TaxID=192314 RepID=A0A1Y0B0S6_9LAMI|nr:hypothetical protein AEK19_MT0730 [Utricularia reniformis]ART30974.1 hypothetical protein AEK19_MT0730 [Utricularia reniformis]
MVGLFSTPVSLLGFPFPFSSSKTTSSERRGWMECQKD